METPCLAHSHNVYWIRLQLEERCWTNKTSHSWLPMTSVNTRQGSFDDHTWEILASAAGTLYTKMMSGSSVIPHRYSHVSSIVPTPEVIRQLWTEHGRQRLVLFEDRIGPITSVTFFRRWDEGLSQRRQWEMLSRLSKKGKQEKERRRKEDIPKQDAAVFCHMQPHRPVSVSGPI